MLATLTHGAGRPLVVLPGFGLDAAFTAAAFEPALARLEGRRRIYVDLPGTGGSPASGRPPTADAVLAAVHDTVAGLDRFHLLGHSFGGYLAAGLARRWPQRLAGLALICCGPRILPADRDLSGVAVAPAEPGWRRQLDAMPADRREHLEVAVGHRTRAVAARLHAAFAHLRPTDDAYLEALRPAGYRLSDEPGPGEAGEDFDGPVLVLSGRRDRIAGYRDALLALSRYPRGDVTVLAEAGHYLPVEQPERFAALVREWSERG
jgi:pimeloyl-ACP methyl ester carboxylesterase